MQKVPSSLNLEHNPFEKSFASKPASVSSSTPASTGASDAGGGSGGSGAANAGKDAGKDAGSASASQNAAASSSTVNNINTNSGFAFDKKNPPTIHLSSNNLTPGGTRKLPFPSPLINTPGLLGYFKSGFTPSDPNLRSGYTPVGGDYFGLGALTPSQPNIFSPGFPQSISHLLGLGEKGSTPGGLSSANPDASSKLKTSTDASTNAASVEARGATQIDDAASRMDDTSSNLTLQKVAIKKEETPSISSANGNTTKNQRKRKNSSDKGTKSKVTKVLAKQEDTASPTNQKILEKESSVDLDDGSPDSDQSKQKNSKKPRKEMTENEKRKSFLERNRLAASKCRQRKKQVMEKMKEDLTFYSTEYNTLKRDNGVMKNQMSALHLIISMHKNALVDVLGFDVLNQMLLLASGGQEAPSAVQNIPASTMLANTAAPMNQALQLQQHQHQHQHQQLQQQLPPLQPTGPATQPHVQQHMLPNSLNQQASLFAANPMMMSASNSNENSVVNSSPSIRTGSVGNASSSAAAAAAANPGFLQSNNNPPTNTAFVQSNNNPTTAAAVVAALGGPGAVPSTNILQNQNQHQIPGFIHGANGNAAAAAAALSLLQANSFPSSQFTSPQQNEAQIQQQQLQSTGRSNLLQSKQNIINGMLPLDSKW